VKILVVDDAAYARKTLSRKITELGHEVIEAGNGKDAVLKSKAELPDIIFMDLVMPELDGVSATRLITQDTKGKVIICSAMSDKMNIIEAIEAGACDYLTKPFNELKLEEVLKKAKESLHTEFHGI